MQGGELHGHLHVQEEVYMENAVRRLRLHRCDHGIASASGTAHGCSIATEGVHASMRALGTVWTVRAHSQAVKSREDDPRHDQEGMDATQGIPK